MASSSSKRCIISCGVGGWYPSGLKRLKDSIVQYGSNEDLMFWSGKYPKGCPTHQQNPYAFKVHCFEKALEAGYEFILWLDCSVWAIRDISEIWGVIARDGHYLWKTGFNVCSQTSDACHEYFGLDRDTSEKMEGLSGSMMGFDFNNERSKKFFDLWKKSCDDGAFKGSREHDNQSSDPRFLFHRQDQSCASIIASQLGMNIHEPQVFSCYYMEAPPASVIFTMRGMG